VTFRLYPDDPKQALRLRRLLFAVRASLESALLRADTALYAAKDEGRNRVKLAEPPPAVETRQTFA